MNEFRNFNFCCYNGKIYQDRETFRELNIQASVEGKPIKFGKTIEELYEQGDLVYATETSINTSSNDKVKFKPYSEPMHFQWYPWCVKDDNSPLTPLEWFNNFYEYEEEVDGPRYLVYAFLKKVGNNFFQVAHKENGYGDWIID